MKVEQLPPHDIEAEEAVLGSIMIDPAAIHEMPSLLGRHFYSAGNGRVFDAMRAMSLQDVPIDVVTLTQYLDQAEVTYDLADLIGLTNTVPTSTNALHYANAVMATSKRRDIISAASLVAASAMDESKTLSEVIETASSALLDVSVDERTETTQSARKVASEVLERIQDRYAGGGADTGLKTGYSKLDEIVRGMQQQELIVIAARPGVGKTALGTNIVENVARTGGRVLVFSLEMSNEQLVTRMIAQASGCSCNDIDEGKLTEAEWQRVAKATGEISTLDIEFDDTPGISVSQINAKARRAMAVAPVDLIVVDYLQLMVSDGKYNNRVQEVGSFSRGLKGLAKSLGVPVLALAQLSRNLERRENKRPILPDLRDSGEIEQDADEVWFLFRADYYQDDEDDEEEIETIIPGLTEWNVAKNRHGKTGMVKVMFVAESGKFVDYLGSVTHQLPGPVV